MYEIWEFRPYWFITFCDIEDKYEEQSVDGYLFLYKG